MMNNQGELIFDFAKRLWNYPRSITGDGLRDTLHEIKLLLPNLVIHEVPTGTKAFDWTVPKEWNVKDAYILKPDGTKICDFKNNNLHLVGYSIPTRKIVDLSELQNHLHSIPHKPNAIPYVTSYYKETWGFCISQRERSQLTEGSYEIVIDSTLSDGHLNYAELVINGLSTEEIFISTYVCHPSMANNELSGPCLTTYLAKYLVENYTTLKYTYRFVFLPETIGSIVYLSRNLSDLKSKVIAGYNISCVGDDRCYSYLPSRSGNSLSDKVALHTLKWIDPNFKRYTWLDRGSDERQYCSPGIDLPIASIMRSKYGTYPEYHTSLDTLGDVVTSKGLQESFDLFIKVLISFEANIFPLTYILGEPQMGRRNLYLQQATGERNSSTKIIMDLLSYCDGDHSILDISEIINQPISEVFSVYKLLESHNLVTHK